MTPPSGARASMSGPMRLGPILLAFALAVAAAGCGGGSSPSLRAVGTHVPPPASRPATPPPPRVPAPVRAIRPRAAASLRASATLLTHGPRRHRWIALTFDADMTHGMLAELRSGRQRTWIDHALFRELRATHTPATIMLTGLWTRTYPAFVRGLARDPLFELENHSYDHDAFERPCYGLPAVSSTAARRFEVTAAERIIERVAGRAPRFFRFPGGCGTAADRRLVARLGLRPTGWSAESNDAFQPDPQVIVRSVLATARPGAIVVAHCIGAPNTPATARAMAEVIPALRARGYRFVTLEQLLAG